MEVIRIESGQIWQEVDPRRTRFIKIIHVHGGWAKFQTVINDKGAWVRAPRTSLNLEAKISRFDGKRGGYRLHQDV